MAWTYSIRLDQFTIYNTRSRHEDTVFAMLAIRVGQQIFAPKTSALGSLNNGTYGTSLAFTPVTIPPDSTDVTVVFQFINSGHGDPTNTQNAASFGASAFMDAKGVGSPWSNILSALVSAGVNLLTANCDGPLAGAAYSYTGQQILTLTALKGNHAETADVIGSDTPHGCGSNSHYKVIIRIDRLE